MFIALLWKELREHLPKAIVLTFILTLLLPLLALAQNSLAAVALYVTLLASPIWVATSTITSEKSRRTADTLSTLPVKSLTVFFIKTACGVGTFAVPLLLLVCVGLLYGSSPHIVQLEELQYLCALGMSWISSYLLILAIGMSIARETTAAMVGTLILLACGCWCGLVLEPSPFHNLLLLPNPFALLVFASRYFQDVSFSHVVILQSAVALAYWLIAAAQYCTIGAPSVSKQPLPTRTPQTQTSALVCSAMRHPLLWKEFREQGVLLWITALMGVILALVLAFDQSRHEAASAHRQWHALQTLSTVLLVLSVFVPAVVACILGFSGMAGDLSLGLADFWQSRPIKPSSLFWSKYAFAFLGISMLLLFFALPYFLVAPVLHARNLLSSRDIDYTVNGLMFREIAIIPFALSLATCCSILFRRTIYGVVMGLLALGLLFFPWQSHVTAGDILFSDALPQLFFIVTSMICLFALLFTLLARFAFVRHWRLV